MEHTHLLFISQQSCEMSWDLGHCFQVTRYEYVWYVLNKYWLKFQFPLFFEVNHTTIHTLLGRSLLFCFCSTLFSFVLEKFFPAADFAFGTFVYLLLSVSIFVFYLLGSRRSSRQSPSLNEFPLTFNSARMILQFDLWITANWNFQ